MSNSLKRKLRKQQKKPPTLPKPNVEMETETGEFTEGAIRAIFCNPVYAGVGPYPAMVTDEQWVQTAMMQIEEDGPAQFLVNMLHTLRASLGKMETIPEFGGGKSVPFGFKKTDADIETIE